MTALGCGVDPLFDLLLYLPHALHLGVDAAFRLAVEERVTIRGDLKAAPVDRDQRNGRFATKLVPDFGRHPGGHRQIASDDAVADLDCDRARFVSVFHSVPPALNSVR